MDPIRLKVAKTAFATRILVILLSTLANALIPDHDAKVFRWTQTPRSNSSSFGDVIISFFTDGLTRWDGQYFLHIANNGYTYENTLAFFPLFPLAVRGVADTLYWLQLEYSLIHYVSALKVAALMVNIAAFTCSAVVLFELSQKVLRDDYLAYRAALFFCINPASIFFTAAYSESLHCLLSFYMMLKLEKGFSIKMSIGLALATATRANALLNIGFVAYKGLKILVREIVIYKRLKELERSDLSETIANIIGDAVIPTLLSAIACIGPFVLFQWYTFTAFCGLTKAKNDFDSSVIFYAEEHGLNLPSSEPSVWCKAWLPMSYSYIQDHYWDVGFLKYFQFRQIPNFILAFPVLFLVFKNGLKFLRYHQYYSIRLGCTYFCIDPAQSVPNFDVYLTKIMPRECLPYVLHAMFLCIFSFFCVHVQIATRMIVSSTPVVPWIAAIITVPKYRKRMPMGLDYTNPENVLKLERKENLDSWDKNILLDEVLKQENGEDQWVKVYFLGYTLIGTILFSNFLPWT